MRLVLQRFVFLGLWICGPLNLHAQSHRCVAQEGRSLSLPIGWASPYFGTHAMGGRRFLEPAYAVVYQHPVRSPENFPKDFLPLLETAKAEKRGLIVLSPSMSPTATGSLALNAWREVINAAAVDLSPTTLPAEHMADLAFILGEGKPVADRTMIALDRVEISDWVTCLWLTPAQANRLDMRRKDLTAAAAAESQPGRKASLLERADFLGAWEGRWPRPSRKGVWFETLSQTVAKQVVTHARGAGSPEAHPIQLPSMRMTTEITTHQGFQCRAQALFPSNEDDAVPQSTEPGSHTRVPSPGKVGLLKGVLSTRKQLVALAPALIEHRPEVVFCAGLEGEALALVSMNYDRGLWRTRFVKVGASDLIRLAPVTGGKIVDAASLESGLGIPGDAFGQADLHWLEGGRLSILDTDERDLPTITREDRDRVDVEKVFRERQKRMMSARKQRRKSMQLTIPVIFAGGRSVYELKLNAQTVDKALND